MAPDLAGRPEPGQAQVIPWARPDPIALSPADALPKAQKQRGRWVPLRQTSSNEDEAGIATAHGAGGNARQGPLGGRGGAGTGNEAISRVHALQGGLGEGRADTEAISRVQALLLRAGSRQRRDKRRKDAHAVPKSAQKHSSAGQAGTDWPAGQSPSHEENRSLLSTDPSSKKLPAANPKPTTAAKLEISQFVSRQQIGSVLQWCMFNIIMILVNNEIFKRYGFAFPLSLTTIHFGISFIGALIAIEVLRLRPKAELDPSAFVKWVLPMAAVTCFNVVLAQLSVRFIPLHTLLLTKALSPGITVLIQVIALGSEFDPWVCGSLLPVMGGMVIAYAPDAQGQVESDVAMVVAALGSVVLGCATVVCAEALLQEPSNQLDSINALYQMVPYSALIMAPPALLFEGPQLLDWASTLQDPLPALGAILISGFFAFCLNFSLFYTIQNTSALTFNVAGNLKMAVSLLFACVLFSSPLTQFTVVGCFMEVMGVGLYCWALFHVRQQRLELSRSDTERRRVKDEYKELSVDVYLGAML